MLNVEFGEAYLACNKCKGYMCTVTPFSHKQLDKLNARRHYCGGCIQKRIKKYAEKKKCEYIF